MTTVEERMRILRMVERGHITAEEGGRLLEALDQTGAETKSGGHGGESRWFRVRVTDMRTGKPKVNVNIPLGLVNVGLRMGAKFAPGVHGVEIEQIMRAVREGTSGQIIAVENKELDERVEIYVE